MINVYWDSLPTNLLEMLLNNSFKFQSYCQSITDPDDNLKETLLH